MYSILTVATYLFSYITFTIYEHNGHQFKYFSEIFSIFLTFYFAEKSLQFSNNKNIQESGNFSQLILLLNNNNKCIDEKYNICYAKHCYKIIFFNILLYGGSPGPK